MSRLSVVLLAAFMAFAAMPGARAGAILDRIRAEKAIRCGGAPRPGLVDVGEDGRAAGIYLDVCRAIGAAILGTDGKVSFDQYDSSKAYDAVRNGSDEVFFLTASEIFDEHLVDKILTGPPIFYETTAIMVNEDSPFQHIGDLAGKPICFSLVTSTQRHLEAWFAAHHLDFIRMGYQEDVELFDTYGARVCGALAAEVTTLADVRLDPGVNHVQSRILPEPLAVFPVMTGTPVTDPEFSAIVAWAVHTLIAAETPAVPWAADGLSSVKIDGAALKLDSEWQQRMLTATGSYGEIYKRNLGEGSRYKLQRGLNAPLQDGGLFVTPHVE